ncbi:MAG: helix-turn-helix transcriptional regulator [Saprospiraceae bacterium]|nr:helix-turn-helix transcriptional regulator [Saprospiraceae bacterium]
MAINELIKIKRKDKNLTLTQLAEIIDATDSIISRWEKGTRNPSLENLVKLSAVLEFDFVAFARNEIETPAPYNPDQLIELTERVRRLETDIQLLKEKILEK